MTLKHHTSLFLYTLHILTTTLQSWLTVNLLLGRKTTEFYLEIRTLLTLCVDVFAFVCMWFYFMACFQGIQWSSKLGHAWTHGYSSRRHIMQNYSTLRTCLLSLTWRPPVRVDSETPVRTSLGSRNSANSGLISTLPCFLLRGSVRTSSRLNDMVGRSVSTTRSIRWGAVTGGRV